MLERGRDRGHLRDRRAAPRGRPRGRGRRRAAGPRPAAAQRRQAGFEAALRAVQRHPILRPPGAGKARLDRRQVELDGVGIDRVGSVRRPEQLLRLRVHLHELDVPLVAPGQPQVVEGHRIDGKHRNRRAVLRAHVPQGRAIGNRQMLESRAKELDEPADDTVLPQALGNRQYEVGRGRPLEHPPREPEAQDRGDEHRDRLAEHGRLRLDSADAPSDDAQAVDHRRMGIGSDKRVGIGASPRRRLGQHHHASEVLQIHLVDDAGVGRHDPEIVEGLLPPTEKRVALLVARELQLGIQLEGVRLREVVDLHRMVDYQFHRLEGVDAVRVAAKTNDPVPHRGEIDHRRDAGEVLQEDARRGEGDLFLHGALRVPPGQRLDVRGLDEPAVLVPEQVLEQDLHRERQTPDAGEAGGFEGGQAADLGARRASLERCARAEAVAGSHEPRSSGLIDQPDMVTNLSRGVS